MQYTANYIPFMGRRRAQRAWMICLLALVPALFSVSCRTPTPDKGLPPPVREEGFSVADGRADERKARSLLAEAVKCQQQDKLPDAIHKARELLSRYPVSPLAPEAQCLLARAYYAQRQRDSAMAYGQQAIKGLAKSPAAAGARLAVGQCLVDRQEYFKAAPHFIEGLAVSADSIERENLRGQMTELIAQKLKLEELQYLCIKYPRSEMAPDLRLRTALLCIENKSPADAQKLLQEIVDRHPRSPQADEARPLLARLRGDKETPEPLPDGLRIGLIVPLTGMYGEFGLAVKEGTELAVEEHNLASAAKVKLKVEDTRGDPIDAIRAVNRLIDSAKVIGIIGEVVSNPTIAAAGVANARGVPLLSPTASEQRISLIGPAVFQINQSLSWQGVAMARYAVNKLGMTQLATLYPNDPSTATVARAFRDEAARLGGKVTLNLPYEQGAAEFKGLIERIKAGKVQALFFPAPPSDIIMLTPQLKYNQVAVQLLGTDSWSDPKVIAQGDVYVEGACFVTTDSIGTSKTLSAFDEAYRKKHNKPPSKKALQGYDAARVMLAALKGSPAGREELRSALVSTGLFTKGVHGQVHYSTTGSQTTARIMTIRNQQYLELEDVETR